MCSALETKESDCQFSKLVFNLGVSLQEQNKAGGAITQIIYPGVGVPTLNPSIETDGLL